jgi:thiol-disulfide isomerase/thioredoxin
MKRLTTRIVPLLAAFVLLAGPLAAADSRPPGIDWFDGSVEQAFEAAKARNTPLFLYWGAVWCPPCVEIRQTVFKNPQFQAQTKLFVPVYLDGDTEQAQAWGDEFGTKVYPTMIVFNPDGEEVTRINAGVDVSAYNDVLGLALERMRPTSELVRLARRDPSALTGADFQQLAYYSWSDGNALPGDAKPELFLGLSDAAAGSQPGASARLYLQYLAMSSDAADDPPGDPARLAAILEDPDLMIACWDYLIMPESIEPALAGEAGSLHALKAQWAQRVLDLRDDPRLSAKFSLYGWRPWLVFHFEGDGARERPLPEHVVDAIRADGQAAVATVAGKQARQSVINTVSNVYVMAGLTDDARALLTAEIGKSRTPYYFMGSLASLEEREGNDAVALEWRRKAYEAAEGPATRIRWWASYIEALTRLAPGEAALIRRAAMEVFEPSAGMDDLFAGANHRNLQRARNSLGTWGEGNDAARVVVDDFDAKVRQACSEEPAQSDARANCKAMY